MLEAIAAVVRRHPEMMSKLRRPAAGRTEVASSMLQLSALLQSGLGGVCAAEKAAVHRNLVAALSEEMQENLFHAYDSLVRPVTCALYTVYTK